VSGVGLFPAPEPRFETPAAIRACAAVRVQVAAQDEACGDTGARDRNLREARELEIRAAALDVLAMAAERQPPPAAERQEAPAGRAA